MVKEQNTPINGFGFRLITKEKGIIAAGSEDFYILLMLAEAVFDAEDAHISPHQEGGANGESRGKDAQPDSLPDSLPHYKTIYNTNE